MKFTRQDIIEIAKKLRIWGKADSDFPKESSPVDSDDVAIVRQTNDGTYVNRRVNLKEAVKAFAPGGGGGGIEDATVTRVVTGPTSDANVELVDNVLRFQFVLEKGEKGDKGDTGAPGTDGKPGTPPNYTIFAFYKGNTQPATPKSTSVPPFMDNGNQWVVAPDATGIWWMSAGVVVGVTNTVSQWSVPIKATGEDGVASDYYNFKYAVSDVYDRAPELNRNNPDPGSAWTDTVPNPISGQYLWMIIGQFKDGTLEGQWSNPIRLTGEQGIQGIPGEDGKSIEYIFTRTQEYEAPNTPVGENIDDFVPSGWTGDPVGPDGNLPYEWTSKRVKSGNVWNVYSSPSLWSKYSFDGTPGEDGKDGSGVEYIYTRTESEDRSKLPAVPPASTPYDDPPEPWTDDPVGVDYTYRFEWVSKRTSENGVWGSFSSPSLWARYSYDGSDGEPGATAQMRYIKTANASTVPQFEPMNAEPGSGWSAIKPDTTGDEVLWAISGSIRSNNTMVEPGWQGPFLLSGTPGKTPTLPDYNFTVYTEGTLIPDPPTELDPSMFTKETDWKIIPTSSSGTWWQCVGIVSGATGRIREWGEVVPLNGKDGTAQDGKMSELRWTKNNSYLTPPAIDKTKRNPSTGSVVWSTQQPERGDGEYIWMTSGIVNPDNTSMAQAWSDPTCVTIPGPKGDVGPVGATGTQGPQGVSGIPGVSIEVRWSLGTYDAPVASTPSGTERNPSGWSLTLPNITSTYKYVWFIQARIRDYNPNDSESEGVVDGGWQGPSRSTGLEGANGVNGINGDWTSYVFKLSATEPDRPTTQDPVPPSSTGWLDGPDSEPTGGMLWWMSKATIMGTTGKVSSEGWTKAVPITGKPGTNGEDGSGYIYMFALSASNKQRPAFDASNPNSPGDNWALSVTPTEETPFVWMTYAIKEGNTLVTEWQPPFCVTGEAGQPGQKGQVVYPMGIYEKTVRYAVTENTAPYVLDMEDGNYYVLNTSYWLGTSQSSDRDTPAKDVALGNRNWVKFEAFEAIFTKILVTPNALVGSAVFNGDYMYSQQGIDPTNNSTSTHYECFNPSDPGAALPDCQYRFLPNVMINYKTGAGHLAAGKIKFEADGSIIANDMVIQNIITASQAKLGAVVFKGDWMISQAGTNTLGSPSTDWESFDPENPKGGTFIPNIAFNFLTGAGFMAGGKITFNENGSVELNSLVLKGGVAREYTEVDDTYIVKDLYSSISNPPTLISEYTFYPDPIKNNLSVGKVYEGAIINNADVILTVVEINGKISYNGSSLSEPITVRDISIPPGGSLQYLFRVDSIVNIPSGGKRADGQVYVTNVSDFSIRYNTARNDYVALPQPNLFGKSLPVLAVIKVTFSPALSGGVKIAESISTVTFSPDDAVITNDKITDTIYIGDYPNSFLKNIIAVGSLESHILGYPLSLGLSCTGGSTNNPALHLEITSSAGNSANFTQNGAVANIIIYGLPS